MSDAYLICFMLNGKTLTKRHLSNITPIRGIEATVGSAMNEVRTIDAIFLTHEGAPLFDAISPLLVKNTEVDVAKTWEITWTSNTGKEYPLPYFKGNLVSLLTMLRDVHRGMELVAGVPLPEK